MQPDLSYAAGFAASVFVAPRTFDRGSSPRLRDLTRPLPLRVAPPHPHDVGFGLHGEATATESLLQPATYTDANGQRHIHGAMAQRWQALARVAEHNDATE